MTNVNPETHWNKTGHIITKFLIISFRICGVFQYGKGVWKSVVIYNRKIGCQNVPETNNSEVKKKEIRR